MELICSPLFNVRDVRPLWDGLYADKAWRTRPVEAASSVPANRRGVWLLTWAIANRRLEIRIALVVKGHQAIYHEKIGMFDLAAGGVLAFEGSVNESSSAYVANFERVVLHRCDGGRAEIAEIVRQNYERLWANETPGLEVISLHEGAATAGNRSQERSDG